MNISTRTLLAASLIALIIAGLTIWLAPDSVDSIQHAESGGTASSTTLVSKNAPQAEKLSQTEEWGYPPGSTGAAGVRMADTPLADAAAPQQPEPDYEAQIQYKDMPPALLNLMQAAFVEFYRGNVEYAAMLSLDALEVSDDYPVARPMLYGIIGHSYEKLGYIDMAIEQYRAALAIYPLHRASYDGMRRLDPEFAASHPKLAVKSAGKAVGTAEGTNNPLTE